MSMTNAAETAFLTLIFTNVAWANVGDASGLQPSAVAGNIYVSLHTATPDETGDQTTNEATYTSYARVAVARSGAAWTVAGNNVSNAAAVTFPEATGGDNDITYFGLGYAASAAGSLYMYGALGATKNITTGDTPNFAIGELDTNVD